MEKKFQDVAHLYVGQTLINTGPDRLFVPNGGTVKLTGYNLDNTEQKYDVFKPLLRPLSSMTEEERCFLDDTPLSNPNRLSLEEFRKVSEESPYWNPEEFLWLTKKGFDLFGLIESGQALHLTYT